MLDGLDQVEWGRLQHAFGTAEDAPHLIRALQSPSLDQRQAAFGELYGNIWHQGTIYEATPYAVPFLIELCGIGPNAGSLRNIELPWHVGRWLLLH